MRSHATADVRRTLCWILVTGWVVGCHPDQVPAQVATPTSFEVTGVFAPPYVNESSGIAVSRSLPGVLWTHNDSGHDPVLYAVDSSGALLGIFPVGGITAVDWEDIALGMCPSTPHHCLYISDTGDNTESRRFASIYVVEEPSALPVRPEEGEMLRAHQLRFRYADGPHDVEALAVTGSGTLLLISKGRRGAVGVYRILGSEVVQDSLVVDRWQDLDIVPQPSLGRLVTGAAVSPNGRQLVVRTYIELTFYRLTDDERIEDGTTCLIAGRELQGEAVDFVDDSTLVLTSETVFGRRGSIAWVRCPVQ